MQWLVEWASLIWLTASAVAGPYAPPARVAPVDTAADRATCEAAIGISAVSACTRAIASDRFAGRELARLYGQRGNELRRIGSLDAALADFDRAIRLDPDDLHAWYKRADTHRDRGEFDFAIADYSTAIERDPQFASALVRRGLLYERKRQLDLARSDFSAALAAPPKYPGTYSAQETARDRLATMWSVPPAATSERLTAERF
jgi:tetratricopeptide (TPR) repeat protein